MRTGNSDFTFAYYRLSIEEANKGESSSITNQRAIVQNYCRQNGLKLVREFSDDGYSGGNFDRPDFIEMMRQLDQGMAGTVVTKDLSRLGRDMRESSYYAEQFFPEHGIRYIAIADNFDTEQDNIMAPFQFAMNEVYLRDGSRKVKDVLRCKRESGQYCACPPYGYRKAPENPGRLVPDEMTAPVVQRIFTLAAAGDSSGKIAQRLSDDGIFPPMKYRVLCRDSFSERGAARASDFWNSTTVKRILKNPVYLGHTLLGKTRKVSVKSKKKVSVPREAWSVTENTHPPLVSEDQYETAQRNLGRGTSDYRAFDHVRKSIFSGIAFCLLCGHAMCSCGTVYKGEREKYWYLACVHQRKELPKPCSGVRVKYADLVEVVRKDLNSILSLDDARIEAIARSAVAAHDDADRKRSRKLRQDRLQARMDTIDKVVTRLYTDNAAGRLDDERLRRIVADLEQEATGLKAELSQLSAPSEADRTAQNYRSFFALARAASQIETLDRETLLRFVERIEIGPKVFADGYTKATHRNTPFQQSIRIFYRFIGEWNEATLTESKDISDV